MRNYKKYLASFLIVLSSFSSTYSAFASPLDTPMRGWTMSGGIAQGASTLYQATKNALINGKNVQKTSSVLVAPVPAKVIKVLVEGGAFLALSVAVDQLLGAVDWVLDPANNRIKYVDPADPVDPASPSHQYIYISTYNQTKQYSSIEEVCKAAQKLQNPNKLEKDYEKCVLQGTTIMLENSWTEIGHRVANAAYDPSAVEEDKEKSIPLSTVAERVISNADSGDISAQEVTTTAAAQTVAEAQTDSAKAAPLLTQLEAAAVTPTSETATGTATQTETKTDPTTGETTTQEKLTDLKLAFPKACEWAPSFCEAAAVVITFPITITKWWETANTKSETWADAISQAWADTKEWATSENKDENTELDFDQQEEATDTTISFDHSCPAPIPVLISWNGHSVDFSFSFDMFCTAMSTYVKPIVIAMGAFHAVLIVSGVRLNG